MTSESKENMGYCFIYPITKESQVAILQILVDPYQTEADSCRLDHYIDIYIFSTKGGCARGLALTRIFHFFLIRILVNLSLI